MLLLPDPLPGDEVLIGLLHLPLVHLRDPSEKLYEPPFLVHEFEVPIWQPPEALIFLLAATRAASSSVVFFV